jgi:N-acetylneuraminate synthase
MCELHEIDETAKIYRDAGAINWGMANCDSLYPPEYHEVRLGMIEVLKRKFGDVVIGHSDHTNTIYTGLGAVAKGARFIEKHITIHRGLHGPDVAVSLEVQEFEELVRGGMAVEAALGSKKVVTSGEKEIRRWASHWVVADEKIKKSSKIMPSMITAKRCGGRGKIPAKDIERLYGKIINKDLEKNHFLSWDDIEK